METSTGDNETVPASHDELVVSRNVIQVGEVVTLGYLAGHDGDDYVWEVVNGDDDQLLHRGTAELNSHAPDYVPHDGRVNSFRPTEPGTYVIRVTVDGEVAEATVTVTEEPTYLGGKSSHKLLQEHAPVLNFHPDERFYPTRYEAYVENANLYGGSPPVRLIDGVTLTDIGADYKPRRIVAPMTTTTDEGNSLRPRTKGTDDHEAYQEAVLGDLYPRTVYGSIHENVQFNGETYTALGYWMVYLHDPKPDDEPTSVAAASHTGDLEPLFVLLDDTGQPQWIAAQQHRGGELRDWERVETVEDRAVIYPAQGAHSNFLGPATDGADSVASPVGDDIEYIYQQQYYCDGDGNPSTPGVGCSVDGGGEPVLPASPPVAWYTDPTAASYPGQADEKELWRPAAAPDTIPANESYEVTVLSGDEPWGEYEGNVFRYPGPFRFKGEFPTQLDRWENDTLQDISLTRYVDSRTDPRQYTEVFPDREQIDGEVCGPLYDNDPLLLCYQGTDHALDGTPLQLNVPIANTGFQPHEFGVTVTASPQGSSAETTDVYSAFVDTGDVTGNSIDANHRTVYLPLDVDGEATWDVDVTLSMYPDELGSGYLEGRYELDQETFTVSSVDPAEFEIAAVPDGSAGGINSPNTVSTLVEIKFKGEPYESLAPTLLPGQFFDVTVGGESVDPSRIGVNSIGHAPGVYELEFLPPTQADPGTYDLEIELVGVDADARSDAITYGEGERTQIATAIQIDVSGSMSGILDEAKEGAITFVELGDDSDYVSVVGYGTNSQIDHPLVRLGDGRQSVIGAIGALDTRGDTNIGDALVDGLSTLDSAPDGTIQAAVHMTDGQLNTEDWTEDEILDQVVPQYNDRDVCLYTIGFTESADEQFMQDLAEAADCGDYRFAGEQGEVDSIQNTLQAVFGDIKDDVTDSETFRSDSGTLDSGETYTSTAGIDDSVTQAAAEIRLEGLGVASGAAADSGTDTTHASDVDPTVTDEVSLLRPDGTEVDGGSPLVDVSVVGDLVIYRIEDPLPGEWTYSLQNPQSGAAEFTVDLTGDAQATLTVRTAGDTYYAGDETELVASLIGPDGRIEGAAVEARVEAPDGSKTTHSFTERSSGVYATTVASDQEGTYDATVTAQRDALSRERSYSWAVQGSQSLTLDQQSSSSILRGESGTFDLLVDPGASAALEGRNRTVGDNGSAPSSGDIQMGDQRLVDDAAGEGVTPADADFQLSELEPENPTVAPGEEIQPRVFIANYGGEPDTQTIEYRIAGTVIGEGDIQLDPGYGGWIGLEEPVTIDRDLGQYSHGFYSADDSATGTLTVRDQYGIVLESSSLSQVGGDGTIPDDGIDIKPASVTSDGSSTVTVSVAVPDRIPAGEYRGTVTAYTTDGRVVTEQITVSVSQSPTFEVEVVDTDSPVAAGDDLRVDARVTNSGDVAGERPIDLTVAPLGAELQSVSLAGGESTVVSFTIPTAEGDDGSYDAVVTSDDDVDSTGITVRPSTNFAVTERSTNAPVEEGATLSVDVTVENSGVDAGTQTVVLSVGNTGRDSTDMTLGADQRQRVTLDWPTSTGDRGEYAYAVETDDDVAVGTVIVENERAVPEWATDYVDEDGIATVDGVFEAIDDFENGALDVGQVFLLIESFEKQRPVDELLE